MKIVKMLMAVVIFVGTMLVINTKVVLYKEGIYEGIGQGHHGSIRVSVAVDQYKIIQIKIIEHQETPGLCDIVYNKLPKDVIKFNNVNVDGVAGASYTSDGLLYAIRDAVQKGKIEE